MDNEKLTKLLIEYISRETDYAVMINGEWGSGKTYFWKHSFLQQFNEKIPILSSNFQPIYISLYGVKSIEDVAAQILLQSAGKVSSKFSSLFGIGTILKDVFDKALGISIPINPSSLLLSSLRLKNKIFKKKYLICVDDLERTSSDLGDISGLFSQLFEQFDVKVVFLCNESKLTGENHDRYSGTKEKLIRYTYQFENDLTSFVKEYFANNKELNTSVLAGHKDFIIQLLVHAEERNLRTIQRSLRFCDEVFKCFNDFEIEVEGLAKHLIRYIVAVNSEFTKDPQSNRLELLKEWTNNGFFVGLMDNNSEAKQYAKDFLAKFQFADELGQFTFPTIFSLITTGDFEPEEFCKDALRFVVTRDKKLQLFLTEADKLSDEDFDDCAEAYLEMVRKAEIFETNQLIKVAHYLVYFATEGLIENTTNEIEAAFVEGLQKHISNGTLNIRDGQEKHFSVTREPLKHEVYQRILHSILRAEENIRKAKEGERAARLPALLKNGMGQQFFDEFTAIQDNIFEFVRPEQLRDALIEADNECKSYFRYSFSQRYTKNRTADYYVSEIDGVEGLANLIDEHLETQATIKNSHRLMGSCLKQLREIVELYRPVEGKIANITQF